MKIVSSSKINQFLREDLDLNLELTKAYPDLHFSKEVN